MILHICNSDKKFILPYIELINKEFSSQDHHFLIYGGEKDNYPCDKYSNVEYWPFLFSIRSNIFLGFKSIKRFLSLAHKSDKIILHGLWDQNLVKLLSFSPSLLRKCYWVMWGADLYYYKFRQKTFRSNIHEFFRRSVIRRLGNLITYIEGDYGLAKKWYGARGKLHNCIMYTSNVFSPPANYKPKINSDNCTNILIGNSADPRNNHLEVLEKLLPHKKENIKIFASLAYGDQEHAKTVIKAGKKFFGNKFEPLTMFMPVEQYKQFLSNVDIAIFNHKRQQAMGNIITLLGMGKKVYIRDDITTYKALSEIGLKTYNIQEIEHTPISNELAKRNTELIQNFFSQKALIYQLTSLFLGKEGL